MIQAGWAAPRYVLVIGGTRGTDRGHGGDDGPVRADHPEHGR
jgi:hypothetical protein